jgi:thiamine thiazole synthase
MADLANGKPLDEVVVSRAIVETQTKVFLDCMDLDVAIVGGGPAGLTAAACLAGSGLKIAIFDRKLAVGGGMCGGGMMYPRIVVQDLALPILKKYNVKTQEYQPGYYTAHSVECVAKLTAAACDAGVEFFNNIAVQDVMIKEDGSLSGLVINWGPVDQIHLHVDPLVVRAKVILDGTGHEHGLAEMIKKKKGKIDIKGEGFMWAARGEKQVVADTKEVFPGMIACGMAATAVAGEPRMGPIFGGMLLSGERAAQLVLEKLGKSKRQKTH